jgi:hypothetical protein
MDLWYFTLNLVDTTETCSKVKIEYLNLETFEIVERICKKFDGLSYNCKPSKTLHILRQLLDQMNIKKTISYLLYDQDIGIEIGT